MKFNLNEWTESNVVMLCQTQEEADIFTDYLDKCGRTWADGLRYTDMGRGNLWGDYRDDTCYRFNRGQYADYNFYIDNGYRILEFADFEWEEFNQPLEVINESLDNFLSEYMCEV